MLKKISGSMCNVSLFRQSSIDSASLILSYVLTSDEVVFSPPLPHSLILQEEQYAGVLYRNPQ